MPMLEILNGDDRPFTLRRLKEAASKAKGASKAHLRAVARSLNPNAARSRASQGASSMSKKTHKAARHHKRRKSNPSTASALEIRPVGRGAGAKAKVRAASRRAVSNLKGADLMGILVEGAGVGGGLLLAKGARKLGDKFLPASLPALLKSGLASAVVAGGAIAISGGKGFFREVAKGAIASLVLNAGETLAPQFFAGTDGGDAMGYWDPATGQWISTDGQVAGVAYDPAMGLPMGYSVRPDGM